LTKAKEHAETANQAKSEFLANMRHDLLTPLSGIVGFAELLKEKIKDEENAEYIDNLVAATHALKDFLNEILEAIRVSSGEIPILKRKFELDRVFEQILALYGAKAQEKNLNLIFNKSDDIPRYVIGDKIRLHRIALELVGNALNFTDNGFVSIDISLAKQKERELVIKMVVKDSGIGIPKDKQQDIYLQFKRLTPSYQGIYKGAGLGLFVVKQFVNELNGEIYVESSPNEGTCFTCIFPFQAPLLDDDSCVDPSEDLSEKPYLVPINYNTNNFAYTEPSSNEITSNVLVVEDNTVAQKAVLAILNNLSCKVECANNGEEAIILCKQKKFDLIFMDIGLGNGMDGYEVTSFIRRQEEAKNIPIVALTAHGGEENKLRCIESGMNGVLIKPLTKAQASDILKTFIPERHSETKLSTPARRDLPDNDEDLFQLEQFALFDSNEAFKNLNTKAQVVELLKILLEEQLPEIKAQLEKAFADKDYPLIEKLTHKLKSSAMYLGAFRLKYACQYVERYWKTGETKLMDLLYQQALRVIDQTSKQLSTWLTGNDS